MRRQSDGGWISPPGARPAEVGEILSRSPREIGEIAAPAVPSADDTAEDAANGDVTDSDAADGNESSAVSAAPVVSAAQAEAARGAVSRFSDAARAPAVPTLYDLCAVSNHMGSLQSGHYTAFARSAVDGEWWEFDDASTRHVADTARIVSEAAYLLFYLRRDYRPVSWGEPSTEGRGRCASDGVGEAKSMASGSHERGVASDGGHGDSTRPHA